MVLFNFCYFGLLDLWDWNLKPALPPLSFIPHPSSLFPIPTPNNNPNSNVKAHLPKNPRKPKSNKKISNNKLPPLRHINLKSHLQQDPSGPYDKNRKVQRIHPINPKRSASSSRALPSSARSLGKVCEAGVNPRVAQKKRS